MRERLLDALLPWRRRSGVEELREDIDEIRSHVVPEDGETISEQLEELQERQEDEEKRSRSNEEAIEHIIEALSHQAKDREQLRSVLERIEELETRIDKMEGRLNETSQLDEKTGSEASGRTSKRVDGSTGRTGDAGTTQQSIDAGEQLWQETTPAQRTIIKTMYDLGYPLSYQEIADEVGRSVSTVKNHINNLKSMGFDFKEDTGYNNTKKYMLDERVKQFLTLRLND